MIALARSEPSRQLKCTLYQCSYKQVYPCHWRDHDHMHTTAGLIVVLVFVAEDGEFRPFHVLSSRAFNCLQPQIVVRMRDDGNEHHVRKITFESHLRQVGDTAIRSLRSVPVVITCASHAQGRRFDPGREHKSTFFLQ